MQNAHVTHTEPETVVFVPMRGPREQVPDAVQRATDWAEHYGLVLTDAPRVLHITTPETDEVSAEWELWLPIAGGAGETERGDDSIGVKRVEPDTVAAAEVQPTEIVGQAYRELESWAEANGLTAVGPPIEVYESADDARDAARHGAEILIPVQPGPSSSAR